MMNLIDLCQNKTGQGPDLMLYGMLPIRRETIAETLLQDSITLSPGDSDSGKYAGTDDDFIRWRVFQRFILT